MEALKGFSSGDGNKIVSFENRIGWILVGFQHDSIIPCSLNAIPRCCCCCWIYFHHQRRDKTSSWSRRLLLCCYCVLLLLSLLFRSRIFNVILSFTLTQKCVWFVLWQQPSHGQKFMEIGKRRPLERAKYVFM